MIGIINYGSGNIIAISNILKDLNLEHTVITKESELDKIKKIILPGVGAFDQTITELNTSGLRDKLDRLVLKSAIPTLGICVGMQIMANNSQEGNLDGLGWIEGSVEKFNKDLMPGKPKLPHMGWNSISPISDNKLFDNIDTNRGFYFLHSYHYQCDDENNCLAKSDYYINLTSAINKDNIYGVQFHPEKSHLNGIQIFSNFSKL